LAARVDVDALAAGFGGLAADFVALDAGFAELDDRGRPPLGCGAAPVPLREGAGRLAPVPDPWPVAAR
jgi:hypothetical protein